jgi:hypothetical protein
MTADSSKADNAVPAPPLVFYMRHALKESLRARADADGTTMTDIVLQALQAISHSTTPEPSTREARLQAYVPIELAEKARAVAREMGCPLTTLVAGELQRLLSE